MRHLDRYRAIPAVVRALGVTTLGLASVGAAGLVDAAGRFDVTIPFLESAPVVDGVLDDRAWPAAAVLDGFVETRPGDNLPAARATTVLLAYDAAALYVGVRAIDD